MIRQWIEDALDGHALTYDEVEAGIKSGDFHLFANSECCMVAEFVESPRMKAIHVFAAGGDLEACRSMIPVIEDFGRRNGATCGAGTGRKGWVRALKDLGYTQSDVAVEKAL